MMLISVATQNTFSLLKTFFSLNGTAICHIGVIYTHTKIKLHLKLGDHRGDATLGQTLEFFLKYTFSPDLSIDRLFDWSFFPLQPPPPKQPSATKTSQTAVSSTDEESTTTDQCHSREEDTDLRVKAG